MFLLGFLWTAFVLGIPQSDTYGFYAEDVWISGLFWLVMGWPGALIVAIFSKGEAKAKLKSTALSILVAFICVNLYLKIDEAIFELQHQANWLESNWRERWWPYPSILVYEEVEDGWYIYYAT